MAGAVPASSQQAAPAAPDTCGHAGPCGLRSAPGTKRSGRRAKLSAMRRSVSGLLTI